MKSLLTTLVVALVAFVTLPVTAADRRLDGTVTITKTEFGLIIGGRSGSGELSFRGAAHPFDIEGFKLGTVGFSQVEATGEVYNLERVEQFAGTYHGAEAALVVGVGGGGLWLENEHGVVLHLNASKKGAALSLGGGQVNVSLRN